MATEIDPIINELTTDLFVDLIRDEELREEIRKVLREGEGGRMKDLTRRLVTGILESWPLLEPVHLFAALPIGQSDDPDRQQRRLAQERRLRDLLALEPVQALPPAGSAEQA